MKGKGRKVGEENGKGRRWHCIHRCETDLTINKEKEQEDVRE